MSNFQFRVTQQKVDSYVKLHLRDRGVREWPALSTLRTYVKEKESWRHGI
jgi:hypothetical protein